MSNQSHNIHLPFVSIIIPFKDNFDDISAIYTRLVSQTYPAEKFEIIFVDNGSIEDFDKGGIDDHRSMFLNEYEFKNSPYSARNRGIEASQGEIIAFIDANSVPENTWLENGVHFIQNQNADLVAGCVRFNLGREPTPSKFVDSITSIRMKESVISRGVAYTANLFIKRSVFDQLGLFEEGIRSGGDVRFTMRATKKGYSLGYCEDAIVIKKARKWNELYRKRIRTGKGYFYTWIREEDKPIWFYNFLRSLKPPSMPVVNKDLPQMNRFLVWFHLYMTGILEQTAFIMEYFKYKLSGKKDPDRSNDKNDK